MICPLCFFGMNKLQKNYCISADFMIYLYHQEGRNPGNKFKKEVNKMRRKFFVINETGGYFGGWEEELCKAYCKAKGYTYRVEYRNLGY